MFVTLCLAPEFIFNVESNLSPLRLNFRIRIEFGELVQVGGDKAFKRISDHQDGGACLEKPLSLPPLQRGEVPPNSPVTLISPHLVQFEEVYGPGTGGDLYKISQNSPVDIKIKVP